MPCKKLADFLYFQNREITKKMTLDEYEVKKSNAICASMYCTVLYVLKDNTIHNVLRKW